jgi:hypothetical protein
MFHTWGYDTTYNTKFLDECEFACFVDQEPAVSPFLYGQKRSKLGRESNYKLDMKETRLFRSFDPDIVKIGIGRGAEFLNVMNGGSLYQKVDGHYGGFHMVRVFYDEELSYIKGRRAFMTRTNHYEMMMPSKVLPCIVIGSASNCTFKYIENTKIDVDNQAGMHFSDPEMLYYYDSNSLCIQPDISSSPDSDPSRTYVKKLFTNLMEPKTKGIEQPQVETH